MRHGKKFNHLGRKPAHRKATLSNMASSLILHKRITTTLAKAKALRKYVEPIITRSKDDTTHSRRMVFRYLQNKESVKELFSDVAEKVASRPGGYTRIIRTDTRLGDNAEMCIMELVDFNELLLEETSAKSKTRRGRRKKKSTQEATVTEPTAAQEIVEEEAQPTPAEEVKDEMTIEPETDVTSEVVDAEGEVVEETLSKDSPQETEEREVQAEEEKPVEDSVEEPKAEAEDKAEDNTDDAPEEDKK